MSCNKWKEVRLEDIAAYSTNKIEVSEITKNNYISTTNMVPNKGGIVSSASLPSTKRVNKSERGDTLISNIRPYFKKIWYSDYNYGVSSDVLIIRPNKEKVYNKYLYYFLSQDRFFDFMVSTSRGTKMPRGDKGAIMRYSLSLPPYREQISIANLFRSLDEKIKVNNKMNETLEEIAQAIFSHWFVDFEFPNESGEPYKSSGGEFVESELGMIPKGWEINKIIDLNLYTSDYVANGSFKALKENVSINDESGYAVFMRNTDLKNNFSSGKRYVDKDSYEFLSKTKLFGNEVIISNVGDVGSVYLCPKLKEPMTLGNNVILLKSETNPRENLFYYHLFKSYLGQHLLDAITGGSVQLKFNKTDFRNLKITTPAESIMSNYLDIAQSIENKIQFNNKQSDKLSNFRDTLLPRLMSGEIRITDAEKEVESCLQKNS